MASPHGVAGQFGYASETSPGTPVTVDTFLPINSELIEQKIEQLESEGVRAGRLVLASTKQGQRTISGDIDLELWNTDIATLWHHAFGAVSVTTNSGQWDYTFTPGDLTGKSLTIQVGRPDQSGTVHPFTWAGCKVSEWTLSSDVGEIATLSLGIIGMSETNGTALASASYDSGLEPFTFVEGAISIDGSTNGHVQSFEITGDNAIEERFRLGSDLSKEPLENGMREYTGTMTVDFDSLTAYNKYLAGDQVALVLTFDNGTEQLQLTLNVRYDGASPELGGVELLDQDVPFKAWHSTNDSAAITAVLTNAEGLDGAD